MGTPERQTADRLSADRPGGDRSGDNRPGGDRPSDDRPSDDRSSDDRSSDDRSSDDRPSDDRPSDDRPSDDRSTAEHDPTPDLAVDAARQGFFALVGLLERLTPDATRVGGAGPAHAEAIRFRHDPALSFSAADVTAVRPVAAPADLFAAAETRQRHEVTTTFLGLTGAASPLPFHLIEDLLEDEQGLQRDFLDLFHHRLMSLLYRLVNKYDAPAEFLTGARDDWSRRLLALGGTDTYAGATLPLPPWRLLRLGALLASRTRNARTLELALEDVLRADLTGAHVEVEEFVGTWVELEEPQLTRLGQANHRLGHDLVLGKRVFDRSGKFRVRFSPLTSRAYDRLLPEGDLFPMVKEIVGRMMDDPLGYELELVLATGAVPPFALSSTGTTRLGHNTWLIGRRQTETRVVVDVTR